MGQRGENGYGKGWGAGVENTGGGIKRYGRREVQTPMSPSTQTDAGNVLHKEN